MGLVFPAALRRHDANELEKRNDLRHVDRHGDADVWRHPPDLSQLIQHRGRARSLLLGEAASAAVVKEYGSVRRVEGADPQAPAGGEAGRGLRLRISRRGTGGVAGDCGADVDEKRIGGQECLGHVSRL